MKPRFKDKDLQKIYAFFLDNPPHHGEYRNIGATIYGWFWRGFDGVGNPVRSSFAQAAHCAGKQYRKNGGVDYKRMHI